MSTLNGPAQLRNYLLMGIEGLASPSVGMSQDKQGAFGSRVEWYFK